jgi:hypothetical protein
MTDRTVRTAQVTDPDAIALPFRPLTDLRDTGVLWALNKHLFHPQGHALALALDAGGAVIGWNLLGDGTEPWSFAEDEPEASAYAAFLASLRPDPPLPPTRPSTPPRRNADFTGWVHTVQRVCNGCGREIGDATEAEINAAATGQPLPDAREECGCA